MGTETDNATLAAVRSRLGVHRWAELMQGFRLRLQLEDDEAWEWLEREMKDAIRKREGMVH